MRTEAVKAIAIAFLIALLPLWRVLRGETLVPGDVLEHCRAFEPTLPEELREAVEGVLCRPALASGLVDHRRLGSRWKRAKGDFDLPGALLQELGVG